MSEDVERAVYMQRLDPDRKNDYLDAHRDVPEGVTDSMERGGVTEFELHVRDDIAVCILEAEDIDIYLEAVEDDEAVEEWERRVAEFKREGVNVDADDDGIPFMERVWTLSSGAEL